MNKRKLAFLLALIGLFTASNIQFAFAIIPPSFASFGWPASGSGFVCRPLHLGADSYSGQNFYGQPSNLYVNSWSSIGPSGPCSPGTAVTGISWRRLDAATNTLVLDQGTFPLAPDLIDLEVIILRDGNGTYFIMASYYKNGIGHFYDLYKWGMSSIGLVSSTQISWQPTYSRISIDGCLTRLFTIAWEEIGVGINAIAGFGTGSGFAIGGTAQIAGSSQEAFPDLEVYQDAASGNFNVSFVHILNNGGPGQGDVTMSDINFFTVFGGGLIFPTVLDVNPAGFAYWTPGSLNWSVPATYGSLNLDRPDVHTADHWSYVYSDFNRIYARVGGSIVPLNTYVLNDGSMGQLSGSIAGFPSYWPTISFGDNGDEIYYGWYSGIAGNYVATQIDAWGNLLVADYMEISNTTTNISPVQSMQFSKQNEDVHLFACYSMLNGGNDYYIENKYVPWGSGSFKPSSVKGINAGKTVTVFPNPFTDQLNISLSTELQSREVNISVTDVLGRTIGRHTALGSAINNYVNDVSRGLTAGTYILRVEEKTTGFSQNYKVQKTE
jgi:hypothetical protein